MSERKLQWLIFGIISFVVWLFYFRTTAPTVVFWDVGEFLATSVILGIPHPPGTPLYVILGKFMTLLPLPADFFYKLITGVAARNNVLKITLISMVTGGLSAGFVYILTVRTLNLWNRDLPRPLVHLSGIFGALIGAFASTVWFNSTEAETYTPANFIILLTAWLAFEWWERKDNPKSLALLIFIGYISVLFTGIHLGALVGFPAILLFIFVVKRELLWYVKLVPLISTFFLLLIATKLSYEPSRTSSFANLLFQGILFAYLYAEKDLDFNDPWVIVMGLAFLGSAFGMFSKNYAFQIIGALASSVSIFFKDRLYRDWRGFAFLLMLIAFSTELFLIIRAKWGALHPELLRINEAEPDDWKSFLDVLTRKQYTPMQLLPRRIPFNEHLALFWRYYSWQYGNLLIPVTILAIFGILTHFANERKSFVLIGGLLILGTLGLIVYLNLKDSPTQPVNPANLRNGLTEVRDRDYFFALGYTMIGLYAGIGLYEIMRLIWANLKVRVLSYATGIIIGLGLVAWQVSWAFPIRDRSHNYIAEDYAYNMLISPKDSGVMYTNGDNDTFPLWFVQEALGVRRDVIIANLSLLNTNWYCKQLKGWGAPISFSYEDIEKMPPIFRTANGFLWLKDIMIRDMIATSTGYKAEEYLTTPNGIKIPKIYLASKKEFLEKVIKGATFKVPIYFAITVSPENTRGWREYLKMEGLAFRLVGKKVGTKQLEGVNTDYTENLLHDKMSPYEFLEKYKESVYPGERVFRYRGVFNPKVWKDETHEKLIRNYASISLRLSLTYSSLNEKEKEAGALWLSREFLKQLKVLRPVDITQQMLTMDTRLAVLFRDIGEYDRSIEAIREALEITKNPILYHELAKTLLLKGDTNSAIENLELALSMNENNREITKTLVDVYMASGKEKEAMQLANKWLKKHPNDTLIESGSNKPKGKTRGK